MSRSYSMTNVRSPANNCCGTCLKRHWAIFRPSSGHLRRRTREVMRNGDDGLVLPGNERALVELRENGRQTVFLPDGTFHRNGQSEKIGQRLQRADRAHARRLRRGPRRMEVARLEQSGRLPSAPANSAASAPARCHPSTLSSSADGLPNPSTPWTTPSGVGFSAWRINRMRWTRARGSCAIVVSFAVAA